MQIPQVIGNKWLKYLELLHGGFDESQAFQELGLKRQLQITDFRNMCATES